MTFDPIFSIGDIIGFGSLIIGIISLFFIKPISKHFNINNKGSKNNIITGGEAKIEQNTTYNLTMRNDIYLVDNNKDDGKQ